MLLVWKYFISESTCLCLYARTGGLTRGIYRRGIRSQLVGSLSDGNSTHYPAENSRMEIVLLSRCCASSPI